MYCFMIVFEEMLVMRLTEGQRILLALFWPALVDHEEEAELHVGPSLSPGLLPPPHHRSHLPFSYQYLHCLLSLLV